MNLIKAMRAGIFAPALFIAVSSPFRKSARYFKNTEWINESVMTSRSSTTVPEGSPICPLPTKWVSRKDGSSSGMDLLVHAENCPLLHGRGDSNPWSSRQGYCLPAFQDRQKWVYLLFCHFFLYLPFTSCFLYMALTRPCRLLVSKKVGSMATLLTFVNRACSTSLASNWHPVHIC